MNALIEHWLDRWEGKAPPGSRRSPEWPRVRREHLAKHPQCCVCGGKSRLQVHHVIPYHQDPEYELDERNLRTMCVAKKYGINCHQLAGHRGDFRKVHLGVDQTVAYLSSILQG